MWEKRKGKDGAKVNQVPLLEECERSGTVDGKEYRHVGLGYFWDACEMFGSVLRWADVESNMEVWRRGRMLVAMTVRA